MVKNMKHIKLFENWAEELEVPEYMKEDGEFPEKTYPANHPKVKEELQKSDAELGWYINNYSYTNFQHFYELEELKFFRTEGYDSLSIDQHECQYKLQDFDGLPEVRKSLMLRYNQVKSLKGLEKRRFEEKFTLNNSLLENLKYCPESSEFDFEENPLLSYYGIKNINIPNFWNNLCGYYSYLEEKFNEENLNDIGFHVVIFSNFENIEYDSWRTNEISINPWFNIYNDPNDVDNFEFLFIPFYNSSENFREKAQKNIENLDMSSLKRRNDEDIW